MINVFETMSTLKIKFLILSILSSIVCNSQHNIIWEEILDSNLSPNQKIIKIDSILNYHKQKKEDSLLERATHKYAIWLYKNKNIDKAIQIAKISQSIKSKYYSNDTILLQHGLNNIGFFYFKKGAYLKSIEHYRKVLKFNSRNGAAANAYSEIGRCYKKLGDFYKSINYSGLAHTLLKRQKNFDKLIVNAINSTESYIQLGDTVTIHKGLKILRTADSLVTILNSKQSRKYNIKLALGNLYNQNSTFNLKESLKYYSQMLQVAKTLNDSAKIATSYSLLGNLYNITDLDKALDYQNKAFLYTKKSNKLQYAINYLNIAYCHTNKHDFTRGIDFYYKAINALILTKFSNLELSRRSKSLYFTPHQSYLLIAIKDLANAYLKKFLTSKDTKALNNSVNAFFLADELIDIIRIESPEFKSKLYWRKKSNEIYGKAIEACFLAKDVKSAFFFMEKNKALLLSEDINNSRIRQSLTLPKNLIDQEIALKKRIYHLENEKTNEPLSKDRITIELLEQKGLLKNLQDSIQASYPEYNPINVLASIVSLENVQDNLDDETIIFEYNISEHLEYGLIAKNQKYSPIYPGSDYGVRTTTNGYMIYISKNDIRFLEVKNTHQLKAEVSELVERASKPFKIEKDIEVYQQKAHKVYNMLFPSQIGIEAIKNKKVVIVPDNYLNYLPFEALVTSLNQKERPNYLIKDCEISYTYSNSFLQQIKDSKSESKNSFLAFAPLNFETYDLAPLENSVIELSTLTDYFDGKAYTKEKASKVTFLSSLANHNIIHLATHANAMDSISPWIAFSDQKLALEELYLTQNKADLVVLSGCNTLQGKQETGEGVMSLARGFFHAGAKSVVSSLWSIDDRSTAYIMNDFYKNLEQGYSKARSLRMAKLNYLQNHSLSEASPHFWATFVLSGNTNALQSDSPLSLYALLLLIPVLALMVFLFSRRKR